MDSPKCAGCSLVGICLPDEVNALTSPAGEQPVRRLYASRDDAQPLYVQSHGSRVGKSGERLEVTYPVPASSPRSNDRGPVEATRTLRPCASTTLTRALQDPPG